MPLELVEIKKEKEEPIMTLPSLCYSIPTNTMNSSKHSVQNVIAPHTMPNSAGTILLLLHAWWYKVIDLFQCCPNHVGTGFIL